MNIRDADAGMNTAALRLGKGLGAYLDIVRPSAGQAANNRAFELLRYQADRLKVLGRGSRETSFDNINLQPG